MDRLISAAACEDRLAFCTDVLQAQHVIDYRDEHAVEQIRDIGGNSEVNVILDTVWGESLGRNGALVATLVPTSFKGAHHAAFLNSSTLHYVMKSAGLAHEHEVERIGDGLRYVAELFSSLFPIRSPREAHAALEFGSVTGKIAIDVENGWD